jgi:hypothetical protein
MPEPHRLPAPIAPCDDCRHRASCGASGLTCAAFERYSVGRTSWRSQPRNPSKRLTGQIRKFEAASAAAELEEIRQLEKRAYKREWARAHPQSGRQSRLEWEKLHVEQRRASRRRWHFAHHEESLAAARAWKRTHRAELLERRRTLPAPLRAELNESRRARYLTNRARILELDRRWRARNSDSVNARRRARRAAAAKSALQVPPSRVRYRDSPRHAPRANDQVSTTC